MLWLGWRIKGRGVVTWLDRRLSERLIGAVALISVAAVFVPILFHSDEVPPSVRVEAPPRPIMPASALTGMQATTLPDPALEQPSSRSTTQSIVGKNPPVASTAESHLDANGLPISWSIQLVSLSSRASADGLVQKLRAQGYNAYIRTVEGMNRVFVGPLVEKADAVRLRDQLQHQQQLNGFVVRFQPERS